MVNERQPYGALTPGTSQPTPSREPASQTKPHHAVAQTASTPPKPTSSKTPPGPAAAAHLQPTFGKPSPLRNPTVKQPNIFNPNPRRPEHHRPKPAPQKPSNERPSSSHSDSSSSKQRQANFGPASREGFYLPGQKRQNVPTAGPIPTLSADFFEIAKPKAAPLASIAAAPRPTFSSMGATAIGPNTTFQPFKPVKPANQNAIVIDDDSTFDPDGGLANKSFGAVDPYMYTDPEKANEDMKALLEGAFDELDDRPKMRLKDLIKKQAVDTPKTLTLEQKLAQLAVEDKPKVVEEPEEDDTDDGTVTGMAVKLLPHQIEGVEWMLDRESGEKKQNGVLPMGGILADDMGLGKTIQSVALILSNPRPPLDSKPIQGSKRKMPNERVGKGTLVIAPLALIKQWESEIKTKVAHSHKLKVLVHHGPSRTKSHLELKKYDVVITTYQIIASEHAGSSDREDGVKVGCFGVHWYRIMLDEAHSIKNRNAKSTQACCALRSWYRWCLTGTPMQNNLDELQSLVHFLRIEPYATLGHWKSQITGPLKSGRGQVAIKRVQWFLKCIMKRRTKDILKKDGALNYGGKTNVEGKKSAGMKIVERKVETVICELDDHERNFYTKLEQRANDRLHDMMEDARTDYIGALVLLLRLRQACNHPQLIKSAMQSDKDALATAGIGGSQSPTKTTIPTEIDDLADLMGGLDVKTKQCDVCQAALKDDEIKTGNVRCSECESDLSQADARETKQRKASGGASTKMKLEARRQRNRKILLDSDDEDDEDADGQGEWLVSPPQKDIPRIRAGGSDDEDAEGGGETLGSIDTVTDSDESDDDSIVKRKARSTTDPTSGSDTEESYATSATMAKTKDLTSPIYPSTKIRRLLKILKTETPDHKVIVFSQFTTMLDLIQPHLQAASIPFVRYDGSLPNPVREAALHSLRTDPSIRVLLCSLKCGSLGLNLTAASRVVIVEPFWNPFVEEQAIDRVHRLNQTVDVRVYKLTVRDTVEERILELQAKKRELANAAIEGGAGGAKLSIRDIMGLFKGSGADEDSVVEIPKGQLLKPREEIRQSSAERKMQRPKPRGMEDPVYGRR